jgi:multiple sugar transport system permease protein
MPATPVRQRSPWRKSAVEAVYWVLTAAAIGYFTFPAFWMLLMSFKTRLDATAFPPVWLFQPTLAHYQGIFSTSTVAIQQGGSGLGTQIPYLINSTIVAVCTTLLTLLFGTPAAYAFSGFRFRGDRLLAFAVLAIRFLPPISYVVPIYLLAANSGLLDTHLVLVLVYTVINLPFIIWMLIGFFRDLPSEIRDAARIDGCTEWGAFYRVLIPLVAPGLAATAIFAFMLAWNDFMIAFILTESQARTMPVALTRYISSEAGTYWGELSAGGIVTIVPMLLFTLLAQRRLVRGLVVGAVKG